MIIKKRLFMNLRKAAPREISLILLLSQEAEISVSVETLKVDQLSDGGMGSLRLYPRYPLTEEVRFGRKASEIQFYDEDKILVIATLYLDQNNNLFELDIWKTDFSPLIEIPDVI